jgi:cation:H+ antiporter
VVSLISVKASPDMAIGNAVGSVVFNSGVIMAIALIAQPFLIKRKDYAFKGILLTAVMALLFVFSLLGVNDKVININTNGNFGIIGAIILLCLFIVFIVENVVSAKRNALENKQLSSAQVEEQLGEQSGETIEEKPVVNRKSILINLTKLIGGAIGIAGGAILLKDNAVELCLLFGISEALIGVTILAIGTSLPELVTMIIAVKKGEASLSIGNIIGANIFNLVLVSGAAIAINPFKVPAEATFMGNNASLIFDIPIVFGVMAVMTLPPLFKGKLYRWQGIALLGLYAAYCVLQFVLIPMFP